MPGLFESRVILYNMKYCILGFNQQKVLGLTKEVKDEKKDKFITISIDVEDLLILSVIADLANRKIIRKVVHDDGQYAWISYNMILEDLPILRIDKKQLRRRLDKLVEFDLIDLKVERINGSGTFVFIKIGKGYEELKYNTGEEGNNTGGQKCTEGVDKNVQGGGQKCTPKDYITKQDYDNNKKEEREESLSKKDELFEECWKAYRRKGSKSKSKNYWNKLKDDEKNRVLDHIKAYVSARDINYQQDFERYLRDKTFDSLVIKGNDILFDPTCATDTAYHPFGNYSILYDDISKQYIYIGYYDGRMSDGYTDDNRPDGATIILNSGRGTIVWSKAEQKWIHKKI